MKIARPRMMTDDKRGRYLLGYLPGAGETWLSKCHWANQRKTRLSKSSKYLHPQVYHHFPSAKNGHNIIIPSKTHGISHVQRQSSSFNIFQLSSFGFLPLNLSLSLKAAKVVSSRISVLRILIGTRFTTWNKGIKNEKIQDMHSKQAWKIKLMSFEWTYKYI